MLNTLITQLSAQIETMQTLLLIINLVLHLLFAGAIARDAGRLTQLGQRPAMVSAPTWAFATLLGGVWTAAIYWFIHHSTLTRPTLREDQYDKS